ncbi:MAG: class I SAM-dependent methyltransferase [Acidobacteria bacterium]|nr:class I SAM-dependent methyltransferase [Acidobacteriota bacterium]
MDVNPTSAIPVPTVAAMVHHCCDMLRERLYSAERARGLLVGCGNGDEVVYMRQSLGYEHVVGVDVEGKFSSAARAGGCVFFGNAESLPFPSEAFDFAAAFHSLEHVADPNLALDEISRVLRRGAWFYAGVPNRSRWIAYLGAFNATTWQKISGNLKDWGARLRGKFRNECGAHAGFEREEFRKLLEQRFSSVQFLTEEFLRFKYAGSVPKGVLDVLLAPSMINYVAPAHYVLCQK